MRIVLKAESVSVGGAREMVEFDTDAVLLDDVLDTVARFLHAAGFVFDGTLEILPDGAFDDRDEE